jgi:hypothetical protein
MRAIPTNPPAKIQFMHRRMANYVREVQTSLSVVIEDGGGAVRAVLPGMASTHCAATDRKETDQDNG